MTPKQRKPTKKDRELFDAVCCLKALVLSAEMDHWSSTSARLRLVHVDYLNSARKLVERYERKK